MAKKKKFPPNPLPCGCSAMGIMDLENAVDDGHSLHVGHKNIHVVHCPLHGAAPYLLAVVRRLIEGRVEEIDHAVHPSKKFCTVCGLNSKTFVHCKGCPIEAAEAAIARATS